MGWAPEKQGDVEASDSEAKGCGPWPLPSCRFWKAMFVLWRKPHPLFVTWWLPLHTENQHWHIYIVHVCVCKVTSAVSNSVQPYGLQPARLLCPWDSPGKNTGVGCRALLRGITHTPPRVKQIVSGHLWYSTAALSDDLEGSGWVGVSSGRRGYAHTADSLCCIAETNTTV